MKSTQLIVAFFVVTTVWAIPEYPWAFFAHFNNTYVPLSGKFLGERFGNRSMFTYGDPSVKPIEFHYKLKFAYVQEGLKRQYAMIHKDKLMFGRTTTPKQLELDGSWRAQPGPFYLCDLMGGPARGSLQGLSAEGLSYCFKVDVYFLPYNRRTRSPIHPEANGKFPERVEEENKCSLYYFGKNALQELAKQKDKERFEEECDIYINGELMTKQEKAQPELKEPCNLHYYGEKAHDHLEGFLNSYKGECNIYINGELTPTGFISGTRTSCTYSFSGKFARETHAQFLKNYTGDCDIFVDREYVPKTGSQ